MIQLNLLPDVKLEFIKARRMKRIVIFVSVVVAGSSLGLFLILFMVVTVFQKQHMNNLTKDIDSKVKTINDIQDIDKILTVQNQLNSLPGLHQEKPVAQRMFQVLEQIIPERVALSGATVNFQESTMKLTGSTDSLGSVNKLVDTIKFTTYTTKEDTKTAKKAFSKVVLSQFSRGEKDASFQVDFSYDPEIFKAQEGSDDGVEGIFLEVPQQETTRSNLGRPTVNTSPFDQTSGTGE